MTIFKVDGTLIKSGAKYNAFIKAKSIAKFGHVIALEILKRKADGDKKSKPEIRVILEAELGGEVIEVS